MAVTNAGSTSLSFLNIPVGIQVTKITDTSADWASVANSTYFYDKGDGLVHYKNSGGVVLELFSAGGLTYFTEGENTAAPNGTVYVDSLTAAGSTTNVDVAITPKGDGAFMLDIPDNTTTGGNKRGLRAVDLQQSRSAAQQVASGADSFAAGLQNEATAGSCFTIGYANRAFTNQYASAIGQDNLSTGFQSLAIGSQNTASNTRAYVLGSYSTCSGAQAICLGGSFSTASGVQSQVLGSSSIASGEYAVTIGFGSVSNAQGSIATGMRAHTFGVIGRHVYASGQESTTGDSQASKFILRNRTTTTIVVGLTTDSAAAGTTNQVILSNQSAFRFKGSVVAKESGTTNAAAWDIDGFIVRGANAAATTLNVSNVNVIENLPGWSTPTLIADTTNGGLQVRVAGSLATNIQWVATVETTEVIYA